MHVQIRIGNLPIVLVCMMDASVAFVKMSEFKTIIDTPENPEDVGAVFYLEGFSIGNETYEYSSKYFYKEIPEMKQWLIQQQMEMPKFEQM